MRRDSKAIFANVPKSIALIPMSQKVRRTWAMGMRKIEEQMFLKTEMTRGQRTKDLLGKY